MNGNGYPPQSDNSIEADLQIRDVTLRRFGFGLHPLFEHDFEGGPRCGVEHEHDSSCFRRMNGLELRAIAHELGLTVSLRFERGEFVNIATTGLQMLDAADEVANRGGGGET